MTTDEIRKRVRTHSFNVGDLGEYVVARMGQAGYVDTRAEQLSNNAIAYLFSLQGTGYDQFSGKLVVAIYSDVPVNATLIYDACQLQKSWDVTEAQVITNHSFTAEAQTVAAKRDIILTSNYLKL